MNYIAEIKAFYDTLELNPLPSPAIALWHALMSIANKTGWQEEFTVAVSVLVLKSGQNAQAIKRARNRLEQDGYISWRARGGNQAAIYHVNSLVVRSVVQNEGTICTTKCTENVPQTEPQCEPQPVPQSVPINKHKHKLNKTKKKGTNVPQESVDEFFEALWKRYPVKKGKGAVSDTQKRKLFGIGLEELARAVERYCAEMQGRDVQYWKHGSTFFNSGYVDYLDDEWAKSHQEAILPDAVEAQEEATVDYGWEDD